jgi:nucleoid-associated protein YgaU
MAVDLRISKKRSCRNWLERTLLSLEKQGLLDTTRERYPPHYHIALFPEPYTQYVARLTRGATTARVASETPAVSSTAVAVADSEDSGEPADATVESVSEYRVNRGDSLWSIARRYGTTVDTLKELNGMRSSQIVAGQTITVPAAAGAGSI